MLSRAFRNRFIELHYEDLPLLEIKTIIEEKCKLPGSYSKKIIAAMGKLQVGEVNTRVLLRAHSVERRVSTQYHRI